MIYHFFEYKKIITQRRDYKAIRKRIIRFEKTIRMVFIIFFVSTNILALSIMVTEGIRECEYVDKSTNPPDDADKNDSL